jgi:hypothetical protein
VTATAAADVELDVRDGVATLALNRPDKLNAVTPGMAARIGAAFRSCDADSDRATSFERSIRLMLESFAAPDLAEAIAASQERRLPRFPPLAPPS